MRRLLFAALAAVSVLSAGLAGVAPAYAADVTVTAANVKAGPGARTSNGFAGEAATAGQLCYKAAATGKYFKSDSNSATVEARNPTCIFLNNAATDQPVSVLTGGLITIGGTVAANTAYYASDTPGGFGPLADVGTGEYMTLIGLGVSSTVINVDFQSTNVAN